MISFEFLSKYRQRNSIAHQEPPSQPSERKPVTTLADLAPGSYARVVGFDHQIPPNRLAHLRAYGLVPGYWVLVLRQSPVTIVQIENTELALENELALSIWVETQEEPH